uniref:Uncharacterized protein n=1 Tax=Meloidogyne incognita TaxID=6306 RepID=A0A914NV38_MELIC
MEEGGNCSTFDSGTGDSAKNSSKKSRRDKKLKEEKTKIVDDDGGKGEGRNGEEKIEEDQINGKILTKNVLLNEESSSLTQQKYNLIEETSGYISMLQIQNNNFEPKPGPSQQQQQQQIFNEPKNHLSSPISAKNKQKLSKKEENMNLSSKNSPLPPLPKNLTEFSEKIDNQQQHHLPFLRRRNFNNGSNGRGKENNNNNKLQHKPSQIANRTSVLLLEDRPLPQLPPQQQFSTNSDDDEIEDEKQEELEEDLVGEPEPPVYVNSTNDSGLGGCSSNAPKDYANTSKT